MEDREHACPGDPPSQQPTPRSEVLSGRKCTRATYSWDMYTTHFFAFPALLNPDGCAFASVKLEFTPQQHWSEAFWLMRNEATRKIGGEIRETNKSYLLNLSFICAAGRLLSHIGHFVPINWFFELHQDHGHVIAPLAGDC